MSFPQNGRESSRDIEPKVAENFWGQSAVLTSDGESIYGWICGIGSRLLAGYVVPEIRGLGVFRAMLRSEFPAGHSHRFTRLTIGKFDPDTLVKALIGVKD